MSFYSGGSPVKTPKGPRSKMADGISVCSRCREPLVDDAFVLVVEKGPSESVVPQSLRLCPKCVESFERWYRKRAKLWSGTAAGVGPGEGLATPSATGAKHSRRRHRQKKQKSPLIRILVITAVSVLLFVFAFYWTWTILKTATRTEE
jgi:hypothetical protein